MNDQIITAADLDYPRSDIDFQKLEKSKRKGKLGLTINEIATQDNKKVKRAAEIRSANYSKKLIEGSHELLIMSIGIEAKTKARIFDNFQQASSDTSRIIGGTGEGLSIIKQLVEVQGGSVQVESVLNEGSRFSFGLSFQKITNQGSYFK